MGLYIYSMKTINKYLMPHNLGK